MAKAGPFPTCCTSSDSPTARLESWIREQIAWTSAHAGIAVVIDFPESSLEVTTELQSRFHTEMAGRFAFNMAVLAHLVADVQRGHVTPILFTLETVPRDEIAANLPLMKRVSSIGLAAMGAAIWMSGQHAAGAQVAAAFVDHDTIIDAHVGMLLRAAAASLDL